MKLTAKLAFACTCVLWVLMFLPFFVPALNRLTPKVLGLPFVVFWQYLMIALHVVLIVVCRYKIWDPFDRYKPKADREEQEREEVEHK